MISLPTPVACHDGVPRGSPPQGLDRILITLEGSPKTLARPSSLSRTVVKMSKSSSWVLPLGPHPFGGLHPARVLRVLKHQANAFKDAWKRDNCRKGVLTAD